MYDSLLCDISLPDWPDQSRLEEIFEYLGQRVTVVLMHRSDCITSTAIHGFLDDQILVHSSHATAISTAT